MSIPPKQAVAGQRRIKVGTRFAQDERGASALEFAIVATPFIFLMLAIFQIGYVYSANFALDGAVADSARMIRTGQAQMQGFDAAKFKQELCKGLVGPLSCGRLMLDVRAYDSFSAAAAGLTQPLDSKGNANTNMAFDPGSPEQVVIVRAFYPLDMPPMLPSAVAGGVNSNMADGDQMLVSTAAFRNEPYL